MTDTADPTPNPLLQTQGLRKSYGSKPALKGIDLALFPGQMVALLGPNGAGKSTLLSLLTVLFTPDEGRITVLGHDMRQHPSRALAGLGVVFQQSALDLDLTVAANLRFHTDLHGMPRTQARERIDHGLALLGLQEQAGAVVRSLSGGNRRKVELARALVHQPSVLLMDEATVGLDPASRRHLLDEVLALRASGVGVLWASHLVDEAEGADMGEPAEAAPRTDLPIVRTLVDEELATWLESTAGKEVAVMVDAPHGHLAAFGLQRDQRTAPAQRAEAEGAVGAGGIGLGRPPCCCKIGLQRFGQGFQRGPEKAATDGVVLDEQETGHGSPRGHLHWGCLHVSWGHD